MREALLGGVSGVSLLFDEVAKNAVVNVFSGELVQIRCTHYDYAIMPVSSD